MLDRWIAVMIAAVVVCGPGDSGKQRPVIQEVQEIVAVLAPLPRCAPTGDWITTKALPPLKSEGSPSVEFILPGPGAQWTEGAQQTLVWHWSGAIRKVRISYEYDLCKLGSHSRGHKSGMIADGIANRGYTTWTVPWLDAPRFVVRLAGYDGAGNRVATCERVVEFRPKEASKLKGTFIVVLRERQRLFFFRDDQVVRMHLVSTGRRGFSTPQMLPELPGWGITMGKVFNKMTCAWSRAYNCPMPWWMAVTSSGMIGLHATTPSAYRHLGSVASHGCIRQHGEDARELYKLVQIGTPVYVF
ncbi:MAG: L,D-transpeptidase [Armatimonadota bacterium]